MRNTAGVWSGIKQRKTYKTAAAVTDNGQLMLPATATVPEKSAVARSPATVKHTDRYVAAGASSSISLRTCTPSGMAAMAFAPNAAHSRSTFRPLRSIGFAMSFANGNAPHADAAGAHLRKNRRALIAAKRLT
jgi:hypothetical protein